MDLFKFYWNLNEVSKRGYTFRPQKQDDYQQSYSSQAPGKKINKK